MVEEVVVRDGPSVEEVVVGPSEEVVVRGGPSVERWSLSRGGRC